MKVRFICYALVFYSLWACSTSQSETALTKPNMLMIIVDDLNDWTGSMGGHPNALTPNIDKLASQGVLFSNAHCQTALCGPSRASIMSGLRPSTTGIYGQISDKNLRTASPIMLGVKFLPEYFAEHGYKTMGVGKIFHTHAPEGVFEESGGRVKGFGPVPEDGKRFHWDKKGTSTDWAAFPDVDEKMPDYKSAEWAKERLGQKHDRPFFMAVGFLRPHVPWYVPQPWFDKHPLEAVQTPPYKADDLEDLPEIALQVDELPMMPTTSWAMEAGQWKDITRAYLASTTFVDHYVGEVLKALENSEHKDNTIVVLWSDHGYRLGEKGTFAKHCLWEEATKVPLIIAGPGIDGNIITNKPVELLDIYPTLAALCGLPENSQNEGASLLPLLKNPDAEWDKAAITSYGRNNHAVRTENYRYIRYENGAEELYDHTKDPNEWDNKAADPEYVTEIEQLRKHLPKNNALWSPKSAITTNTWFAQQMSTQTAWPRHTVDASSSGADGVKLADINGDGLKDVVTGWEEGGLTKLYLHPGHDAVKNEWPAVVVGSTPDVEDAVFADMNNDGKPEVVSCSEGKTRKIYVHSHREGDWLKPDNWKQEVLPASDGRMMWMYAEPQDVDGQNGPDLIAAGKGDGAELGWFEAPTKANDLSGWKWHPISPVGWVMSIINRDMDGDGDTDIVITDRKGPNAGCRWLENPGVGDRQKQPWKSHMIGAAGLEVMFMALSDLDGDGAEEAIVPERTKETTRIFRRPSSPDRPWKEEIIDLPEYTGRAKSVEVGDVDGDGVMDFVHSTNTYGREINGLTWTSGKDKDRIFKGISGPHNAKYDKVELLDIDGDGDLDVLICEENFGENSEGLGVVWYENPEK